MNGSFALIAFLVLVGLLVSRMRREQPERMFVVESLEQSDGRCVPAQSPGSKR
jgi:hypothetical protein